MIEGWCLVEQLFPTNWEKNPKWLPVKLLGRSHSAVFLYYARFRVEARAPMDNGVMATLECNVDVVFREPNILTPYDFHLLLLAAG